ncbi:hypothetical protein D3C78_1086420 [compost metagenome]
MLIQNTCNHVRDDISPLFLLTKRYHVLLDHVEHRTKVVLGILQLRYKQFCVAVAGSAAHAIYGSIKQLDALLACKQRISEGKLKIVMSMNTQTLIRQMLLEFLYKVVHIIWLQAAV